MIGQTLSHYQILEKLGEGGMGVVYKARDNHLDRLVAIKVLLAERLADPDRKRRFVQEAKAASALNHPNIITIYDIDQAAGLDFIAMEYVTGKPLDNLVVRKGLKLTTALKYAVQMADGLAAAHAAGIIHRDLKPANVMVTENGLVKVLDFGLAKLVEQAPAGDSDEAETVLHTSRDRTVEGAIVGTISYMSPEQAEGKPVDARSDIFSLGLVLYEMVTGRKAFQGATKLATLSDILHKEPKRASEIVEGVPTEVERIISLCLRKEPSRRFQHMSDVKVELEELKEELESGTLLAMPTTSPRQIAVLDFANISNDPSVDWLCGGIAETVTADLKKISSLRVVSRDRVLKVAGQLETVRKEQIAAVGKGLGSRWVVSGAFQKSGNTIRITAGVIDVATGDLLVSSKVDGSMENIFALQDNIISNIVHVLDLNVPSSEMRRVERPETEKLEAYEYYARGRRLFNQLGRSNFETAEEWFKKAVEADSNYALAYSGLGSAFIFRFIAHTDQTALETGIRHLKRAIDLDPELAEPYYWLTYAYGRTGRHFEDAIQAGKRAIQLEPDNGLAFHFLGVAYHCSAAIEYKIERYRDATSAYRETLRLVPNYEAAYLNMAWIHMLHGKCEQARRFLERAVEIEEDSNALPVMKFVGAHALLGNLYLRENQLEAAETWYLRSLKNLEKIDHMYCEVFLALTRLGIAQVEFRRSNYDVSLAECKKVADLVYQFPKAMGIGWIFLKCKIAQAMAFHQLEMLREAKRDLQEALDLFARKDSFDFSWIWEGSDAQTHQQFACYYALAGNPDKSLESLEKAIDCGWADAISLENDAAFGSLRTEPHFQNMIASLKTKELLP